jgi:hypothetical protein
MPPNISGTIFVSYPVNTALPAKRTRSPRRAMPTRLCSSTIAMRGTAPPGFTGRVML